MALDREKEDYAWAMEEWLKTPVLSTFQMSMIIQLRERAKISVEAFNELRETFMLYHERELWDAIIKARTYGIGKKWNA